jgi:small subunit ribosomal protein S11e
VVIGSRSCSLLQKHRFGVQDTQVGCDWKVSVFFFVQDFVFSYLLLRYVDKKCPWTGNVSIRGRILKGRVVSNKMNRTVVVRRDSLHYIKKYNRYEKRHRNTAAHASPAFLIKEGDTVTIGECRPLSKTVHFNVVEHFSESGGGSIQKNKLFRIF